MVIVNDKLERMWKEVNTSCFKVLSQHLTRISEENHDKCQSGLQACGLRIELGTSEYKVGVLTHWTQIFGYCFLRPKKAQ
jgi:hypothetical protein